MTTLLSRNAAFVYLSFVVSGLTNVVPQRFFDAAAPASKQAWLAATLLLGTVASLVGVRLAQRYGFGRRSLAGGVVLVAALTAALLAGFELTALGLFVASQVLARLLANYATQELDRRAVALATGPERTGNDRAAMALRFLGMLLGPVWFGAFGESAWVTLGVVALALISCRSVLVLAAAAPSAPAATRDSAPLSTSERLLAAAAMTAYGAYYLLASNVAFILRDLHGYEHPYALAGLLVTTVYGAAVVTSVASAPWARRGVALGFVLLAPATMLLAAACLHSSAAARPGVALGAAAVLGVAFAFFMLAMRNHVTREVEAGRPRWLAVFNNLGNTSALVGFSTMTALVALSRSFGVDYASMLVAGLCGLGVCSLLLAWPAIARDRPRRADLRSSLT